MSEITQYFNFETISDLVHIPINIRIVSGNKQASTERAYATKLWHVDAWAGEPLDGVVAHLFVFGDTESLGSDFGEMETKKELNKMRIHADYRSALEGLQIREYSINQLKKGCFYFADPRLLHRTRQSDKGLRVSIDFRFRLKSKIFTEITLTK